MHGRLQGREGQIYAGREREWYITEGLIRPSGGERCIEDAPRYTALFPPTEVYSTTTEFILVLIYSLSVRVYCPFVYILII